MYRAPYSAYTHTTHTLLHKTHTDTEHILMFTLVSRSLIAQSILRSGSTITPLACPRLIRPRPLLRPACRPACPRNPQAAISGRKASMRFLHDTIRCDSPSPITGPAGPVMIESSPPRSSQRVQTGLSTSTSSRHGNYLTISSHSARPSCS